ncbi:MAG: type II secretion system protein [bacterium]|nr:type II secretion system protein [bacterium]
MLRGRIKRGFTLIELMIVMTVIAVLAAIMVPNYTRARAKSQLSGCEQNEKNIATAIEMYLVKNQKLPPVTPDDWTFLTEDGKYLKLVPTCPAAGSVTYNIELDPDTPTEYTVYCKGSNHEVCDIPPDYPVYSSSSGLHET